MENPYITCSKCKKDLPATKDFFHKGKDNKYGLRSKCKACRAVEKKIYREKHRDKLNQQSREYHKIHREKEREYKKKYYEENKEKIKLKRPIWWDNWYQNNKDELLEKRKIKYRKNREYEISKVRKYQKSEKGRININIHVQKRKARLKDLPHTFSSKDWSNCLKYFNNKCCYCDQYEKLTKDHFIPLSKGGEFTKDNILPACLSCNLSKHNNDFYNWYRKQPFYSKIQENKILAFLGYKDNTQQLSLI